MKLMRRKINEKSDKDEHSQEERTMRSLKKTNFELSISTMNFPIPSLKTGVNDIIRCITR